MRADFGHHSFSYFELFRRKGKITVIVIHQYYSRGDAMPAFDRQTTYPLTSAFSCNYFYQWQHPPLSQDTKDAHHYRIITATGRTNSVRGKGDQGKKLGSGAVRYESDWLQTTSRAISTTNSRHVWYKADTLNICNNTKPSYRYELLELYWYCCDMYYI